MKKALLPVAILAALPAVAMAEDEITLYGRANVSVDFLDDGADYSEFNASSNSSRLGFRAQRDFDGIIGIMQIEQEIDYSDSGSSWASRDTFAGIRGDFGMVRFGKFDTPFKRARGPANLFGDQLGDMRNLTRAYDGRFDERMPNTMHYQTPSMSGVQFNLAYSLHEGGDASADGSDDAFSTSVTWQEGNFDLALAYENFDSNRSRGGRDAIRFALGYDLGNANLVGFYQTIDHDDDTFDSDVFGFGASFRMTEQTLLKGHYLIRSADIDDGDSNLLAVGIEHRLASQLRIYANYAMVSNDDNANLNPWSQARTTGTPGSFGETASGLSLGLRFDF
ncbi:porin [Wenzhouxiangella sp. AB-CW3]|uniref:porin n=1 Tax=Wenzhouxiangella sp. AB-CW3 TaxID=2771012 RepID=UPI00168A44B7|nr:porin [Wenzhouxiangella sp. AB-CW3]QOC21551.1 porin [Wenzhouxiangella sp. AB-CW3]